MGPGFLSYATVHHGLLEVGAVCVAYSPTSLYRDTDLCGVPCGCCLLAVGTYQALAQLARGNLSKLLVENQRPSGAGAATSADAAGGAAQASTDKHSILLVQTLTRLLDKSDQQGPAGWVALIIQHLCADNIGTHLELY